MYNKYLDIFICVADEGSFLKASKKLYVSPNAVRKKINLLEEQLGVKLFNRSHHGLTLTKAGQLIYQSAQHMIKESSETLAKAKYLSPDDRLIIRIGYSLMRPCNQVINIWQRVSRLHPEIKLKMIPFSDERDKYSRLIANLGKKIDIISGAYLSNKFKNKCQILKLGEIKLSCAVPLTHHLATHKLLHFSDLDNEKVVLIRRGKTEYMDKLRDEIEKNHPKIQIIDDDKFNIDTLNFCEKNNLIMITVNTWRNIHPAMITIPVDWSYTLPYGLLYPLNPNQQVQTFVNKIKRSISK